MIRERRATLQVLASYMAALASFAVAGNISNSQFLGLSPAILPTASGVMVLVWIGLVTVCFRYHPGHGFAALPGGLLAFAYPLMNAAVFVICSGAKQCI